LRAGRLAAAWLLAARAASADPATVAADRCKAGDLDGAARALTELLAAVEASNGVNGPAAQVVKLNLAHVERARGNSARASELEKPGEPAPGAREPDPELARGLRGLRACAGLAAAETAPPPIAEIRSEDHLDLARGLLARGLYPRALESAQAAQQTLGPQAPPQERLRLLETLALIRLQLGQTPQALEVAREADTIAKANQATLVRITLARLVAQAGDLEAATTTLNEIEKSARTPEERAELDEARGDLALRLGSTRQAAGALERAAKEHAQVFGADDPSTASVHVLRGDALRLAGDFPGAAAAYREALRIRSQRLGATHPETARARNAQGVLEADLGDWQAADASFAAAEASLKESLGAEHPETLTVRSNRALARWGASRSAQAAAEYSKSVEALAAALGEDHPSVAAALRNAARIELDGGNAAKAGALLDRALAAQRKSLGDAHPALAATRLARGRVLARQGDFAGAAREIDAALATLTREYGPDHPLVARARMARSRVASAQGDGASARREAFEASRAVAVHTRRTFGAISDRQRALLVQDAQEVAGALLSAPDAPARELYLSLLPHRDSVLRSISATRAATATPSGKSAQLQYELAALRARYVAAALSPGAGTAQRTRELADKIDGLEAVVAGQTGEIAEPTPAEVLAAACQHLPADAALVELVAYDRTVPRAAGTTQPAYAALVVRGGSCDVRRVELASGMEIESVADRFGRAMREQRNDEAEARAALSKLVLAPLAPALEGASRWLVVPDGSLWGIPLGALPDPKASGHYLFERVTVGYLTSGYELAQATPGAAGATAKALLIGAPEFGVSDRGGPVVLTDTGPCQLQPFEPLPATRQELDDVAKQLGTPAQLVGADASKQRLEEALRAKPELVHFATHAYFAGDKGCGKRTASGWREGEEPIAPNPLLLSGIVLAGANQPNRVDGEGQSGILTAYEVAALDLRSADLVALSACDTGTGLRLRGQEIQGLRWGFRAAGAHALVTSLWRSNDVATRRLMAAFYEALAAPGGAADPFRGAEALRHAQLAQIESEQRLGVQRPLLWANFVFSGVL
jgi:CHAT domain-containing protein/predicted negative regulator of RcsB-dependent stress response